MTDTADAETQFLRDSMSKFRRPDELAYTHPRCSIVTTSPTLTVNVDNFDVLIVTAQATAATVTATGSPVNGQALRIIFSSPASAQALTWGAGFSTQSDFSPTANTPGLGFFGVQDFVYVAAGAGFVAVSTPSF